MSDARRSRPDYYRENIDHEVSEWCDARMAEYPGVYKSKRALLHDLLRRGMISWTREFTSSGSAPQGAAPRRTPAPEAPDLPMAVPSAASVDNSTTAGGAPPARQQKARRPSTLPEGAAQRALMDPEGARGKAEPEAVARPGPPAAPATGQDTEARADVDAGTRTCGACGATLRAGEEWIHRADCPGRPRGPPAAGWRPKDERALVGYVRSRMEAGRLDPKTRGRWEANPRVWLVGMTQLGARDQGAEEPSEQEAWGWVRAVLVAQVPLVGKLVAQVAEDAAPPRTAPAVPKVTCARCGELVETSAAAREAHFKTCPPDPPASDEDRLVEDVRARILARDSAGEALDPELERDLKIAAVQQLAQEHGLTLESGRAAALLDRARSAQGAGPSAAGSSRSLGDEGRP